METALQSGYSRRVIDDDLDVLLAELPALSLVGAKGVGKTATASRRVTTIHSLDDPVQRNVALAKPSDLLEAPPPVLIDEWQHVPETWDLVRRAVDRGADPGQFLLAGSASPAGLGTHSGAGRISDIRMRPLALAERGGDQPTVSVRRLLAGARTQLSGETDADLDFYIQEIGASGLPGLRGLSPRASAVPARWLPEPHRRPRFSGARTLAPKPCWIASLDGGLRGRLVYHRIVRGDS